MALPTSYCSVSDVGTILGDPGLTAWSDDDHSGTMSVPEASMAWQAIERAANLELNYYLWEMCDLQAMHAQPNQWLRWANAVLAAYEMMGRRGGQLTKSLMDRVLDIRKRLREVRDARGLIPDAIMATDWLPAATNYEVERWRPETPVRVVPAESTRARPGDGVKRETASPTSGHVL